MHLLIKTKLILLFILFISINSFANPLPTNHFSNLEKNSAYVRANFLAKMKVPFKPKGKKKALIIGDSHAQDFLNGIVENHYLSNYQISTRYIPTRCQIYLSDNMARYIKTQDKTLCAKSDNLFHAKDQISKADLIILVASWKEWAAKELPQTIKNLNLTPQQKLLVIGRKSFSKTLVKNFQELPREKLLKMRNKVDEHQTKINKIMKQSLTKDTFIDIHQIVCGTSNTCPVFTDSLKLISFDGGHLSKDGARYVVRVLFQGSQLSKL